MSNKCREPGPGQLNWYHHGFNSKLLRASASPELAFVISTWMEPSVGGAVLVQKRGSVCPGLKVRQVRLLLEGASQCGAPAPGTQVSAGRAGREHVCCQHPRGTGGMGDLPDCWLYSPAMDGQGEHWESNPPIRGCLLRRLDSPGGARGEEPDCQCRRLKRRRFNPWVERISWRRAWQPTPVFLPGKSHGQRSLAGYSLWSCTDSDTEASSHTAHINEVGGRLSGGISEGQQMEYQLVDNPHLCSHLLETRSESQDHCLCNAVP